MLICVAKSKAELCYVLDFNLALSEVTVKETQTVRKEKARLKNRMTNNDITSVKIRYN